MTNYLQTRPHRSKLYLSVYQPDTILACQINDVSISKGERAITYNLVTEGSYLLIEQDMVMYIGTSAGKSDKGRIRVRSATSTVITVAENDHINWSDNDYLTVVRFWNIDAIFPRIVKDPSEELGVIFYKDYDVVYDEQNRYMGGFVSMGSHYAGFLDPASGLHDVYYDASGTMPLTGSFTTFDWFFEGATVTGSSSMVPGYVTYDTPGHYTTRLSVTGTSGGETSYRHISIYDRPGQGDNIPVLKWELDNLSGNRDQGGHAARINIRETVDEEFVKEGSLVVIFSDDWYGTTQVSIGGNQENREKIFFVGYVIEGSIQYDYQTSFVTFMVESPVGVMKLAEGFSISVESKTSPSTWFELYQMDIRKAVQHYLKWQSTVLRCVDVKYLDTEFNEEIQYFDADRSSLFDAINSLMEGTAVGSIVSDRQGTIWCETRAYANPNDPATIEAIQKVDWIAEPSIRERISGEVSWLEMGGIAFELTGASGTSSPLIGAAPGDVPAYRGKVVRQQGLALTGQAQLNTLVGNVYAHFNSKYPELVVELGGNYRNYDIAPNKIVPITIGAGDTVRQITLTNEPFIVMGMAWFYDSSLELLRPQLILYQLKRGTDGDTIIIPVDPPTEGDGGGFDQLPPFELPPIPPLPLPGGINRLALYDEGVFLGLVAGLNFVGGSVVADIQSADLGRATYTCALGGDAIIAAFRNNGIGEAWAAIEALAKKKFGFGTSEFTSGITYNAGSERFEFDQDGYYIVNYFGDAFTSQSNILPFPDIYFSFKFYITLYDSGGSTKEQHIAYSDRMFLYEIDGSPSASELDSRVGTTVLLNVDATDYLEVEAEGVVQEQMIVSLAHDILIYKT